MRTSEQWCSSNAHRTWTRHAPWPCSRKKWRARHNQLISHRRRCGHWTRDRAQAYRCLYHHHLERRQAQLRHLPLIIAASRAPARTTPRSRLFVSIAVLVDCASSAANGGASITLAHHGSTPCGGRVTRALRDRGCLRQPPARDCGDRHGDFASRSHWRCLAARISTACVATRPRNPDARGLRELNVLRQRAIGQEALRRYTYGACWSSQGRRRGRTPLFCHYSAMYLVNSRA